MDVNSSLFYCLFGFFSDGELNVLEDILTEAPDQDDELYNPETERDISDKKGTRDITPTVWCWCKSFQTHLI